MVEHLATTEEGTGLAVLMIDVDRFKRYNDQFGHLAADSVLEHLADVLSAAVRDPDLVSRYGGDEFVVLFPDVTTGDAARLAERLRNSANNQLAEDGDADRLHERGILYAPDFIANGGGALAFGLIHRGVTDDDTIAEMLDGIGTTLGDMFREASDQGASPHRIAISRIEALLR